MSFNAITTEKKQRPIPPQGPQIGVCYSIIDLGNHMVSFQGQPAKQTPLVHFSWEFPNLPKTVFNEGEQPKPLAIFQEYSTFLGDRSKLTKLLTAWRGVPPKDLATELPQFLGQPCLINVVYAQDKQRPDITYANVAMNGLGVMRLPAGTPVAPLSNPKMFFNLDQYSHAQFLQLPKWIQKKIMSSLEWSGIVAKFGPVPAEPQAQGMQNNTGFQQQAPAFQQPVQNFNQPPVQQGFQTNVTVPAQNTPPTFGGQPVVGNPFENDQPPF